MMQKISAHDGCMYAWSLFKLYFAICILGAFCEGGRCKEVRGDLISCEFSGPIREMEENFDDFLRVRMTGWTFLQISWCSWKRKPTQTITSQKVVFLADMMGRSGLASCPIMQLIQLHPQKRTPKNTTKSRHESFPKHPFFRMFFLFKF